MRIQHDIFNTPIKVNLTIADESTPSSYARYPEGKSLGKTMPMWRVQTEGYKTHKGQLIGIVSSDSGFLDSPDTEWISGGVNSKGPKAVALGRHGNFFHWGFAASPTYLTDEAKDVFVNALHYIAKFDRQAPIARKKKGTMLRSALDSAIKGMSDEGYAETQSLYARLAKEQKARNALIRKKIEAGENVSDREQRTLGFPLPKVPGRLSRAARFLSPAQLESCKGDHLKATALLQRIRPYLRPSGYYTLAVDEDLQKLGIANSDIALLEHAIAMHDPKLGTTAQDLLERYTDESFKTKAEWTAWLKANRNLLFFTEAGGYKWIVNTLGQPQKPMPKESSQAGSKNEVQATPHSPLAAGLSIEPKGEGRYRLTVKIDILNGWHAYDYVPSNSAYTPLRFSLALPKGISHDGKWSKPPAMPSIENPGVTIFEGQLAFTCELIAADLKAPSEIACTLSYQVCDERLCMPPTTKRLTKILVAAATAAAR